MDTAILDDDVCVSYFCANTLLLCGGRRVYRMVYCIAYGCNHKDKDRARGVRFHRLPLANKPLLKQWLVKLRLKDPPVTRNSRVCSEHFSADCFERDLQAELLCTKTKICLKPDAVPTIFSFAPTPQPDRSTGKKRKHEAVSKYLT